MKLKTKLELNWGKREVEMAQMLMLVIGLYMLGSVYLKRGLLYRLLHARASIMWKDRADLVLMVSSLLISLLAILWMLGVIWA